MSRVQQTDENIYKQILMDFVLYKGIETLAYMMAYQPERERRSNQHAL